MSLIRVEKTKDYSVIHNEGFRDARLSARSKGIFAYIMTLPDDWRLYKGELFNHFSEGRDALNTAFKELEEAGYIERVIIRDTAGVIVGNDYIVKELSVLLETRLTGNPSNGKPASTKYSLKQNTKETKEIVACAPDKASLNSKTGQKSSKENLLSSVEKDLSAGRLEAFSEWLDYKTEIKSPYKPMGFKALIKKWRPFSDEQLKYEIQRSMSNGWKGLFEPEGTSNAPKAFPEATDLV